MCCWFLRWRIAATAKHYKLGLEILGCVVIFAQLARIAVVGYEIKTITNEFARKSFSRDDDLCDRKSSYAFFSKSTAILFCCMSMLMAALCCFVFEPLLLWSLKKRHLPGIQPWFVSTMLIFLIALILSVVTFSIYFIKPIDHNNKEHIIKSCYPEDALSKVIKNGTKMHAPPSNVSKKGDSGVKLSNVAINVSDITNLTIRVAEVNGSVACIKLGSHSESVVVHGPKNTTQIVSQRVWLLSGGKLQNLTLCKDPDLSKPILYEAHPVLAMSFLIDIVRCLPQLFFVNRFVKAEKLHVIHMTPHPSLSALYIKHP